MAVWAKRKPLPPPQPIFLAAHEHKLEYSKCNGMPVEDSHHTGSRGKEARLKCETKTLKLQGSTRRKASSATIENSSKP